MQIVFFDPFYGTSPMDTSRHTVHTLHLWQMPTYQIPHTLDHKASRGNKQNKYEINSKMRGGSVVLFHSFHSFSLSYSFVLWFISLHVLPLPVPDIHTPPLSESGDRDIPISMVHHADLTEGTTRRRTPGTQRKMSCQETKWSSSSSNVSISMTSLFWRKERQKKLYNLQHINLVGEFNKDSVSRTFRFLKYLAILLERSLCSLPKNTSQVTLKDLKAKNVFTHLKVNGGSLSSIASFWHLIQLSEVVHQKYQNR